MSFVYKVPAVDFEGEDMKIDIKIIIKSNNGIRPEMKAVLCNEKALQTC